MARANAGEDHLSALPFDALLHVLSFLPSDDAVCTSVLARRWRHLWKSTRSLRLTRRECHRTGPHDRTWRTASGRALWTTRSLTSFISHFLLLRGAGGSGSPIDEFEISCGQIGSVDEFGDGDMVAVLWIRHALSVCHARVLRFSFVASTACVSTT
ncbi:unnamed protein product [Urochloa humidicola]